MSLSWLSDRVLAKARRASLRQRLAVLLLPFLVAVTGVELWMTRKDAVEAANSAYDRSLLGALKAIDASISTASGGLSVELPYRLFEFFELTANGQVYFRIATSDGLVELGSADMPMPSSPVLSERPVFYDDIYYGEAVRLVAYRRALDRAPVGSQARTVLVQVAESTLSRQEFIVRFVQRAAYRDSAVLILMLLGTMLALATALRPLAMLARQVKARRPDDVTSLPDRDLPADVRPLVTAVNHQMARVELLLDQRRTFLDDASHQLRTHLTTLQMQIAVAQRLGGGKGVIDALSALEIEVRRATRTTRQLLTLGRSDSVEIRKDRLDLAVLLRTVAVSLLARGKAKNIDLGIEATPLPCWAIGDAGLLQEALTNLMSNAIDHTPMGSVVTASATCVTTRGGGWLLAVEDNGPGLSEDGMQSLGKRYRQGEHASSGGSGLGLAIARSIAGRHGGELGLHRRPDGSGLRATIWWPDNTRDRNHD
ncbi:MAG: Sensor protein QseC [Paracidovorax wautersii]|uniref:histidine kinase n=1 Tax=Paracidovorax wautersii TaxID=1177982 RepID=A0A7V8FRH6_9BURK|nr:MAG: Sensor protein QseC [Paracidovorax wautersii]